MSRSDRAEVMRGGWRRCAIDLGLPIAHRQQISQRDVLDAAVELCKQRLEHARGARLLHIGKRP